MKKALVFKRLADFLSYQYCCYREATDNTYATAKRVSDTMGGGRVGGFRGNSKKEDNINKTNNQ